MRTKTALGVILAMLVLCSNAAASGPAGVFAMVDKVVFEPSEAAAERIQIWGAFSFIQGEFNQPVLRNDSNLIAAEPERGVLYFTMPAGASESQKAAIRKEWADMKAVAGRNEAIAFGEWYFSGAFNRAGQNRIITGGQQVKVESALSPDAKPAPYTVNAGITKLPATGNRAAIIQKLQAALKK